MQTAVISVDVPRTARLDMLQTIGRTHLMGEGIAKLLIAQEAIERVGGVADGKKLQEGGHGGPTLIAGRPLRHPRAAFAALALPAERQVGLKEEAAAKREKEREKKKQQMLNKRKSIRSQVSKKVKEQQELAITRSKMMNTGDLQSRIGDEEDKKVIGMIAAKYFGDLPSVDMNNPIEVQQRLDFFFDACIEARISPVVEWIALVLGIEWPSLRQIMTGKRRDDSLQQKCILKLILQMQSMWAYNGMYGQENPAEWIFRAKNYFGMRDNVEVTVAPPEQPLGDAQSAEQLAQKYQTALPKEIDVEYREVDD
jgi:hypothetical protein